MVMTFRVSELQVLLGFTGRSKSGRKNELMQRALAIVANGCATPIQIKILELYKRRTPLSIPPPSNTRSQPPPAPPPSNRTPPYDYSKSAERERDSSGSYSQPKIPVHPDVKFKHLPFLQDQAK